MGNNHHKACTYYIIGLLLIFFPLQGKAQLGVNDAPSMEAMISNHKMVRVALSVRALAELGVKEAHENSQKSIEDYKAASERLDRYKRSFDLLDLILNGTATAFHGVRTYNSCKRNISAYLDLLKEYEERILLKGRIWSSDSIIYTTSKQAIDDITTSATSIYKSYIDLAAYLTGTAEMDTESMMVCLQCINENMDDIDTSVKNAYCTLYSYMLIRTGFWKKEIFMAKTIREMALEAYESWKRSQYLAFNKNKEGSSSSAPSHKALGGGGLIGGRSSDDS